MQRFNFERIAELIVSNAEFSHCLPLVKEAFHALRLAEQKVDLVIRQLYKYYDEHSQDAGEDCDGSSLLSLSLTDEGEPVKKKKRRKKTESRMESDNEVAVKESLSSELSACTVQDVPKLERETLKTELIDEMKMEIILNTVTDTPNSEKDPLACSDSLSASSEEPQGSSRVSCKRKSVEQMLPSAHQAVTPVVRVIPSALLMKTPTQLGLPGEASVLEDSSHSQNDIGVPCEEDSRRGEAGDASNVLRFEFDRNVDSNQRVTTAHIIKALKTDDALRGCWLSVIDIKRSGNFVTGRIQFPDVTTCLNTKMKGLRLNGFQARLTHEVEPVQSYANETTPTPPEPSTSEHPEDEFWSFRSHSEFSFVDERPSQPSEDSRCTSNVRVARLPQPNEDSWSTLNVRDVRFPQTCDVGSSQRVEEVRSPQPSEDCRSTPNVRVARLPQPSENDRSILNVRDVRFPQTYDDGSSQDVKEARFPHLRDDGSLQGDERYPLRHDESRNPQRARGGRYSQPQTAWRSPYSTEKRVFNPEKSKSTPRTKRNHRAEHPSQPLEALLHRNRRKRGPRVHRGRGHSGPPKNR